MTSHDAIKSSATALMRSGHTIELATVSGLEKGWCNVRHHLIEKYTSGTSRKPMMVPTAVQRARRCGSFMKARIAKAPAGPDDAQRAAGRSIVWAEVEDAAGHEEIFVHAQKDMNEVVEHDHTTRVKNNHTNTVDVNDTESVGGETLHL